MVEEFNIGGETAPFLFSWGRPLVKPGGTKGFFVEGLVPVLDEDTHHLALDVSLLVGI